MLHVSCKPLAVNQKNIKFQRVYSFRGSVRGRPYTFYAVCALCLWPFSYTRVITYSYMVALLRSPVPSGTGQDRHTTQATHPVCEHIPIEVRYEVLRAHDLTLEER